jgi:hypothetical protein
LTTHLIAGLSPAQSPPPVSMPILLFFIPGFHTSAARSDFPGLSSRIPVFLETHLFIAFRFDVVQDNKEHVGVRIAWDIGDPLHKIFGAPRT